MVHIKKVVAIGKSLGPRKTSKDSKVPFNSGIVGEAEAVLDVRHPRRFRAETKWTDGNQSNASSIVLTWRSNEEPSTDQQSPYSKI